MTTYKVRGGEFQAPRDWREYLRAVVADDRQLPMHGLNPNYDNVSNERLLGDLVDALEGTPEAAQIGDAALSLMEQGTDEELRLMYKSGAYDEAPHLVERVAELAERQRPKLERVGFYEAIVSAALRKAPDNERLRELVKREATKRNAAFYEMAARAWPEWFGAQIPTLVFAPDGNDELDWLTFAPREGRPFILNGIAAAGPTYVRALVESVKQLRAEDLREEMRSLLRTHS